MDWYIKCLTSNYANFSGRARRTEFWMFALFNCIAMIILGIIDALVRKVIGFSFFENLYILAVLIPSIAVSIRRLHDTGRPGFFILLSLIPILGWIPLLIFYILDSQPETNQYGPNPKLA